ncbi:MAG: peptide ABC transporter substrate-binding protein [Sumerlaeia bacterium]
MKNLLSFIGILCLALFVGCSSSPSNSDGSSDSADSQPAIKRARVNVGTETPSLDPNLVNEISAYHVIHHLFEPLVRMDEKGLPTDGASISRTHNDDYTVWTFKLREGMKWSNGDPVTAGDYVYSIERMLTPDLGSRTATMVYSFLKNGEKYYKGELKEGEELGIKALDDLTLEFTLANPTPYFISNLSHSAWYPLNRRTIEEHGIRWTTDPATFVSNGPFIMTKILPKDRVVVKKNPDFWDAENVYFDEIEFLYILEQNSELSSFISKEIDMTGQMSNREAPNWIDKPEFYGAPAIATYYLAFNHNEPPFTDVNFRKAISYSIHRSDIVKNVTQRGERATLGFIPHGITLSDGREYREFAPKFFEPEDFPAMLEKAKAHLKDSAYGEGGESIPKVTYLYNSGDQIHLDVAVRLQNYWEKAFGFTPDLQILEWKVMIGRMRAEDYQFARSSWFGDYLDAMTFLEIFETGHGNNNFGYSNPEYDDLLKKIRMENDVDKRLAHIIEAEIILLEKDAVVAPVFEYLTPILVQTNFKNFIRTPLGGLDISRAYRE